MDGWGHGEELCSELRDLEKKGGCLFQVYLEGDTQAHS